MICLVFGGGYVLIGLVVRTLFSAWYDREVVPGHPVRIMMRAAPFLLVAGLLLLAVARIES